MEKDAKPTNYEEVVRMHMLNSTIIGVNRILPSPFRTQRLFWTAIVMVGMGVTAFHASVMIREYFSYPFQTVLSVKPNDTFYFPAVTVCNHNGEPSDPRTNVALHCALLCSIR
jgi:hypothetical protein